MPSIDLALAQHGDPVALPPHKYADLLDHTPYKSPIKQALATDGFVVVPAIPEHRALAYADRAYDWLEAFQLGFDRRDEATWTNAHLPVHVKGGMFASRVYHEDFLWAIRCEQGVVDGFAELWGTDRLTTSFDGAAVMLCHRKDLPPAQKWEHMDQSPNRRGFFCAQGIVNLLPNGPDDGGLMVLKGSGAIMEKYFEQHPEQKANHSSWGPADWYGYTEEQQEWFYERGCEWIKVCANPGDLILWDSRTLHYNRPPSGDRTRICTYVCMAPDELLNAKDRAVKQKLFADKGATTHNPFENIFARPTEDGELKFPVVEPSARMLQLAGVRPYDV
ncbi:hypothetical protein JCM3775_000668 [Rhodotorula graminis]